MSSGSYEIDTYSWYRSLPLSNQINAYQTGTLFAVGDCAFLKPYTFYQYQSTVGATDTSTLSNTLVNYSQSTLQSAVTTLNSNIDYNRRQIVSTIPLVKWISSSYTSYAPFTFQSSFPSLLSNVTSSFQSTIPFTLLSTGLFGYTASNIYPSCSPYTLFSTIPVLTSTFSVSNVSTLQSNFISTIPGPLLSSVNAPGSIVDFQSTLRASNFPYTLNLPPVWLGGQMQNLLDTRQYNAFVDCQYSLYISTNTSFPYWVSSVGAFALNNTPLGLNGYVGRTTTTRTGQLQMSEIHAKQMFVPEPTYSQVAVNNSNYNMNIVLTSSIASIGSGDLYVDVFVPGENNFTFTLVPRVN
jgi:hypothetical protein